MLETYVCYINLRVSVRVCARARSHMFIYIHTHTRLYVSTHVRIFVCMFICLYLLETFRKHTETRGCTYITQSLTSIYILSSYLWKLDFFLLTERRRRVVNTPAMYSGGPRFKSPFGGRLSCLRFLWFFSVSPGKCLDSIINKAITASFNVLSNSTFTYHPFIQRYAAWVTERAWLQITNK
jgi:hypothetical protein